MNKVPVTAAIVAYNEADMIDACLATLSWCQDLLVLDTGSSDDTGSHAQANGATVIQSKSTSFAMRREELLRACKTNWILYIDADERVTPELAAEMSKVVSDNVLDVVSFPRRNYFFGRQFNHGGWQGEVVTRLFRVSSLKGWHGSIHESPVFEGTLKQLEVPLWHFSHRSVADGLAKSAVWTPMEAQLLAETMTQKVSFLTVLRKGLGEYWRRWVLQAGWKDGSAGRMEVLTQVINRMLVFMQVWERQQIPPIASHYEDLEKEIKSLWQKSR